MQKPTASEVGDRTSWPLLSISNIQLYMHWSPLLVALATLNVPRASLPLHACGSAPPRFALFDPQGCLQRHADDEVRVDLVAVARARRHLMLDRDAGTEDQRA